MRLLGTILRWAVGLVLGLVILIALSIPFDALIGRGRVDALTNTSIANPAGPPVRAYLARPPGPGPHPAVIMIHEWWGLREELIGKAEALAADGYLVVVPDTFRGSSTGWIPRAIFQVSTSSREQVRNDLDAVYAWLAALPDVRADAIAVIGFCYGGRTSLLYSLHNENIAATGVFYGMTETTPEALAGLRGPVLGIFGGADASIPLAEVDGLRANLAAAGVEHTISVYPGQPHAFVTGMEAIRAGGAPGEAWEELLAFLRATLQASQAPAPRQVAEGAPPPRSLLGAMHHRFVCGT